MDDRCKTTRFLELNKDEHQKDVIFRLRKGWTLEFRSGASLFGVHFNVLTNHPVEAGLGYRRDEFHVIPWDKSGLTTDPSAFKLRLEMRQAGSFQYRYENVETHAVLGSGFFLVDPDLKFANGDALPLDGIVLQTVVVKLLGPLKDWESRLKVTTETGYNMLHFTPIQELGDSNSAYALNDQLKLAPTIESSMEDVGKHIQKLYRENSVLSVVDIVLNHTAHTSPWLPEHPEAAFNMENSPHLRPAFLLDQLLRFFSKEIEEGKWADRGIPANITEGHQIDKLKHILWHDIFPRGKLHEFYLADVGKMAEDFRKAAQQYQPHDERVAGIRELKSVPGPAYSRFGATVDMEAARAYFNAPTSADGNNPGDDGRIHDAVHRFSEWLNHENGRRYEAVQGHLAQALTCIAGTVHYERIQHDGRHLGRLSSEWPLVPKYFHTFEDFASFEEAEAASFNDKRKKLIMAHNGWVMSFDPLKNFASEDVHVYFRRELIPWTDNVKLRYGEQTSDCPYLWSRMREYVTDMSRMFHGVRLDNAHSTPLVVAEYMLDAGRAVNPDLYVMAELFTGSEGRDSYFMNRLGLTSLVREAESAVDSHDLGRYVHRFGGDPVGAFIQPPVSRLRPAIAHAVIYDQTHDNPSMIKKHSLADVLPSAAVVSMAYAAAASTRGYDELVPFALDIVTEKRPYRSFGASGAKTEVALEDGILGVRRELNKLHFEMARDGYSQVFVDQMDPDTIAITRHSERDHSAYIAVVRNAFRQPAHDSFLNAPCLRPLQIEGSLDSIVLEACVEYTGDMSYQENPEVITGLTQGFKLYFEKNVELSKSRYLAREDDIQKSQGKREIRFVHFPPGAVVVFRISLGSAGSAAEKIKKFLGDNSAARAGELCRSLSVADFNRIFFRTGAEEADDGKNGGVYTIKTGSLPYCGLQGFVTILEKLRGQNDLGHAFCQNLRSGDWMMDYISGRLRHYESTVPLADWLDAAFADVRALPRYLVPRYFCAVLMAIHDQILQVSLDRLGRFVKEGSSFARQVALGTYQMCGIVMSSKLPPLSPKLPAPQPPKIKHPTTGEEFAGAPSLAAGHTHFSTGYMRNWGRDTFISLNGLLLITEQFQEARYIILAFASCLRHGLIPNLLSEGIGARFNARDAVWFWLYSIQQYVKLAPKGEEILIDLVSRLYEKDDSPPGKPGEHDQPLHQIVHEALTVHVQGLNFRERNAGWNLDREMCSEGFNNGIGVDLSTGFVYGGNPHNCGTWMDKMGSSEKAGTKGKPATPRDGSAVELVGLCYAAVSFLGEMNEGGKYPHDGVKWKTNAEQERNLKFSDWAKLIKDNFELRFFVDEIGSGDHIRRDLVNVTPIYKDTYGSFHFWADYQLRPNLCIAMVVAPEMFDPQHAWRVLDVVQQKLLGPLGMKTLNPDDWTYDGVYDNSDDSTNAKRAHGFNYHQGPEWVWVMGYFLRAKLIFAAKKNDPDVMKQTRSFVESVLSKHWEHIQNSEWKGLPELTQANGAFCPGSCQTQAWSMACILEALHCLQENSVQ